MESDKFKALLESTIDAKVAAIMSTKGDGTRYLTYFDAITMTTCVRNIFKNKLGVVPAQIEAACKLSEASLAPSLKEKEELIRAALGIGGGVAGIAMIISGIAAALGWGAGMIAAVTAFFVGVPLAGPIAWITAGMAVAAIAGYFALTGNPEKDTERFINALKGSVDKAVDAIWPEHQETLSKE